MATKKKADSAAKAKAAEIAAKQAAADRRNTIIGVAAIVVVAVAIAVAAYFIINQDDGLKAGDEDDPYGIYTTGELIYPSAVDESQGFPVGQSGVVGDVSPEGAIRVDIYEDPICPFCSLFNEIVAEDLVAAREAGDVVVYYHPISFLDGTSQGTNYSTRAVSAMASIAEHDPANFEAFLHSLLINAPEEGTKGLTNGEIAQIARDAGVSEEAIEKIKLGEFTQWVAKATEQSSIDGVRGTPTVMFDGAEYTGNWTVEGQFAADIEFLVGFKALNEEVVND